MKLSKRLQAICNLVEEKSHIIDVGCDHALIDIFLVQNKKVEAIAADVNKNALNIAIENIKKYQLENKIKTVLTDGVKGLDIEGKTIIICGMGTQTIIDIIKGMESFTMKDMIIQTNHDIKRLRLFLEETGFEIIDEVYLKERNKSYIIMKVIVNQVTYDEVDYLIGPIIKKKYPEYIKNYIAHQKQILKKIPKQSKEKRLQIEREIKQIEKELL